MQLLSACILFRDKSEIVEKREKKNSKYHESGDFTVPPAGTRMCLRSELRVFYMHMRRVITRVFLLPHTSINPQNEIIAIPQVANKVGVQLARKSWIFIRIWWKERKSNANIIYIYIYTFRYTYIIWDILETINFVTGDSALFYRDDIYIIKDPYNFFYRKDL